MDVEKKKHNNKKNVLIAKISVLILFILFSLSTWIPVTERLTVDLEKVDGGCGRFALITDLHSCYYGKGQKWLLNRIDKESPDIVMLGGDFFDDVLDDENAKITAEYLVSKYPCYYVTGNHEFWSHRQDEMKAYLKGIGVHVLEGNCETVEINGCLIDICGVDDPTDMTDKQWKEQLDRAYAQTDDSHIRVLLTHRPERVDTYEKYDFDLILAGHAHAGQFYIPVIGRGLLAPDQGFMAEYVNGLYTLPNGSLMEVSRGLGRESTPLPRYFNQPEVVIIELE